MEWAEGAARVQVLLVAPQWSDERTDRTWPAAARSAGFAVDTNSIARPADPCDTNPVSPPSQRAFMAKLRLFFKNLKLEGRKMTLEM